MIITSKYNCHYCFTTAHESAQSIVKYTSNCDIKAKSEWYILEEKLHYFYKTKYVYNKKHHEDCALLVAATQPAFTCSKLTIETLEQGV